MKVILISFFITLNAYSSIEDLLMPINEIKIIQKESVRQKIITKPYGLWLKLVDFHGKRNYCLWYKTPYKKDLGEIKLLIKKAGRCEEKEIIWYQGKITNLSLKIKPSKMSLSYEVSSNKKIHTIFFINRLTNKPYELFDSAVRKKYLSGLHLLE